MTADQIRDEYFEYLYQIVCSDDVTRIAWRRLLWHLFNTPFRISFIQMDVCRIQNGLALRNEFADECNIPRDVVWGCLEDLDGSVFEVMIALCLSMENNIMASTEYGDRTSLWFWMMIDSLGLNGMNDINYDPETVDYILDCFMDREYGPDGKGSLFYVPNCKKDLRYVEIWYQACEFLNYIINEGRE